VIGPRGLRTRRGALFFAFATLLSGCFATSQRREELLIQNARTFNDDWRWARWDAMASAMPADEATRFLARAQTLEPELVVADFEVTSITFLENASAATVIARFEWYLKRDPTVRNTTVEERWENRDGAWKVTQIRRTRGDRFGLVPEPATPPAAAQRE
jgi:hypothetical protein